MVTVLDFRADGLGFQSLDKALERGHGGTVVTHSPPTSDVGGSNLEPYFGKVGSCLPMVGSLQDIYSCLTLCPGFLCPRNYLW